MRRSLAGVICGALLCSGGLSAQEKSPPTEASGQEGDIVHLKTGKAIKGFQVIKETPYSVEVEMQAGWDPLVIPMRQVESIEYDDIDPRKHRASAAPGGGEGKIVIHGKELSPDFHQKLVSIISEEELVFQQKDFVAVLEELAKKKGVTLVVAEVIKNIPKEKRIRSITIKPNSSLYSFLNQDLPQFFKRGAVRFEYDKIKLSTKAALEAQEKTE